MKKPKPITVRALITRLSKSLATLARCAEEIARHSPDEPPPAQRMPDTPGSSTEKPRRPRGRPPVFITPEAKAIRKRAHERASQRKARALKRGKPAPAHYDLRTPKDMPPTCMRAGALVALGLTCGQAARALDLKPGTFNNAIYRFQRHAGLLTIRDAREWFDAMRADPTAYAPSEARRTWAVASHRADAWQNRSRARRAAHARKASPGATD